METKGESTDSYSANEILAETVEHCKRILGTELGSITIERAVLGLFFSGVKLSTGHGGLCYTPVKDIPEAVCCPSSAKAMPLSGTLAGKGLDEYFDYIFCDNILKKTLGIAALNATSAYIWEKTPPTDYAIEYGLDAFDQIDIPKFPKTVVVGALVPMLKKLIAADADFTILEMSTAPLKPRELKYYAHADTYADHIPGADLLVITGVTILNDTLPSLLKLRKAGAEIVVTGPTASMLPDSLFSRGVTITGGIIVTKPDELLDIIAEGGSGYHFFGKFADRTIIRRRSHA